MTDNEETVDEATAIKRQQTAACAAIDHASTEGMSLLVMVFGSNDGETLTVFGIEGVDVGAVLEVAAAQQWDLTETQPLIGN